ncbi:MAG: SRPBCC domain-containing protein [Hyphomicrobium sp.]
MTDIASTIQVYRIVIKATAQSIWDAITTPEWTERYGYGGRAEYELTIDGKFSHKASAEMKSFGMPDEIIVGHVVASDPPGKLTQTWHPLFCAGTTAEPHTRLTYEINENQGGVCTVTITHDVAGAPIVASMVAGGGDPAQGGGGWPWILSDLKSLLETGKRMSA